MRFFRLLPIVIPMAAVLSACAADMAGGDSGEELDVTSGAISGGCAASRARLLAAAPSAARKQAMERGFTWLDANVQYSQSKSYKGYRTDCSGFVSMCWELGQSMTTADFIADNGSSKRLGSYDDLLPGDAIVHRSGGSGHVVLFLGWNDAKKSGACVLEQASTASDMQFRVRTTASLNSGGYKAIRATKLAAATATKPEEPAGPTSDPQTETATETETATSDPATDPQACFLSCLKNASAKKYAQCSAKCTNDTCDEKCFEDACGATANACEADMDRCDKQCGTGANP
jgi:hypothetical protein